MHPIQMRHHIRERFSDALSDQFVSFEGTFRALHCRPEICAKVDM